MKGDVCCHLQPLPLPYPTLELARIRDICQVRRKEEDEESLYGGCHDGRETTRRSEDENVREMKTQTEKEIKDGVAWGISGNLFVQQLMREGDTGVEES